MGYLTSKQFSDKWGITERRIIKLCKEERIKGALKNGMVWLIPENTIKPSDKRSKIAQYINTQKRIMIANINNEIGYHLIALFNKEGYIVEGLYHKELANYAEKLKNVRMWRADYEDKEELKQILKETEKYYDGFIFIDLEGITQKSLENKEWLISEFSKKMNCESAIILVNNLQSSQPHLEEKLARKLKEEIGLRINAITIEAPMQKKVLIHYYEIAEDILGLLTKFKNTTGITISTDGGYLEFDEKGRTEPLETGVFYKTINNYFKNLDKESYMWCASTMLEDEWTEEPAEMNFRVSNLEAANRGAKLERIFIFSKSKIKEFRNNKTLKIYMQSNINTMFVDYDEVENKEPELLKIVRDGWDGIDKSTLIVDLPSESTGRGYISINEKEVQKAYQCFQKLKSYAKDLREVLK